MKHLFKLSLMLLSLMLPATASAYDFEVDGIYYNVNGTEVTVTSSPSSNEYSGDVIIPETVTYEGKTYSVTVIGYKAFYNCSGLTSITIPNSVTSIDDHAFSGCSGLTSVTIPNSVTTIREGAFYECTSLTSIEIGNSVTTIGDFAFAGSLEEKNRQISSPLHIIIPNSVTTIGDYAFACRENIETIELGNSVNSIGVGAFLRSCSGINSITVANDNQFFDSRDNCNAIIESSNNTLITGCKNTIIPNSISAIGEAAFYGCSGLTSVTIPNTVTTIGNSAFYYCSGLTSITIPNSVTSISSGAFSGCSGLTSVTIPNSVTTIGNSAFYACSGLTSFTIPNSVTSIGDNSFGYCRGLTSITIPNSVTSISSGAFSFCSGLTSVTIPNSVTTIGNSAFCDCSGLTSVTIPNSVTFIGDYAFDGCRGLTSVTIGNSVMNIGDYAFRECSGLTSIHVESGNTTFDSRNNCNAIIETATNTLITGCMNTTIPNSVTNIGNYAFFGCSGLTSVTIPNSVTSIGYGAFEYCSGLNDVFSFIVDPTTVSMGSSVFYRYPNNSAERTLHVPVGSVSAYQADTKWSQYFGSIVEMEPEPVLAESIQLNVTTAGLNEGASLQLTATVLPEDCYNKTVLWSSNNPIVATVDGNGLVTTHSVGTATITAMTTDGSNLNASCTVTLLPVGVKGDVNGDSNISISDVTTLIDYLLTGHWPE